MKHVTLGLAYSSRKRRDLEVVNSVVVSIDPDREKAMRAVKLTCAYLVSWLRNDRAEVHSIDLAVKNRISEYIRVGEEQAAAKLVDDKMINLLTATGNVNDCIERCNEYLSQDVNQLAFCEPFGPKQKESITMLAKNVIPKL